jgi:CspA family cold shock protein
MQKGFVKWFDSKKGYGFISKDDGSGDIFVHYTQIKNKFKMLMEKQLV